MSSARGDAKDEVAYQQLDEPVDVCKLPEYQTIDAYKKAFLSLDNYFKTKLVVVSKSRISLYKAGFDVKKEIDAQLSRHGHFDFEYYTKVLQQTEALLEDPFNLKLQDAYRELAMAHPVSSDWGGCCCLFKAGTYGAVAKAMLKLNQQIAKLPSLQPPQAIPLTQLPHRSG